MNVNIGGNPMTSIVEDISNINEDRFFEQNVKVESDPIFDLDLNDATNAISNIEVPTQDIISAIGNDNSLSRLLNSDVVSKINNKATDILADSGSLIGGGLELKDALSKIDIDACDFSLSDLALDFKLPDLNLQIAGIMQLLAALFCIEIPDAFSKLKDYLSGSGIEDSTFGKAIASTFSNINPTAGLASINDINSSFDSTMPISVFNPNVGNDALMILSNDKSGSEDPVLKYNDSVSALDIIYPNWSTDSDGVAPYKLSNYPEISSQAKNSMLVSSATLDTTDPAEYNDPVLISNDLSDDFYLGISKDIDASDYVTKNYIDIDKYI